MTTDSYTSLPQHTNHSLQETTQHLKDIEREFPYQCWLQKPDQDDSHDVGQGGGKGGGGLPLLMVNTAAGEEREKGMRTTAVMICLRLGL